MFFIGTRGRINYIISTSTEECWGFDDFGEFACMSSMRNGLIDINDSKIEVDMLSILGSSVESRCEVLFNGYVKCIDKGYHDVHSLLRSKLAQERASTIAYHFVHEPDACQVLMALKKGGVSLGMLSSLLNVDADSWVKKI